MNKTQKVVVVLLTSLIGMLLCGGVASAGTGNCCVPIGESYDSCRCEQQAALPPPPLNTPEKACLYHRNGIWMGDGGCDLDSPWAPCDQYCTEGGKCVPEKSTIVLLVTGLLCMAGYFRFGRRQEKGK